MSDAVSAYLNNLQEKQAESMDFVSYFMQKDSSKPTTNSTTTTDDDSVEMADTKPTPNVKVTPIFINKGVPTLSQEELNPYSSITQKMYKLSAKIYELNHTDVRSLDRYMTDFNYANIRRMMDELLGSINDRQFDLLKDELMEILEKKKRQADIIKIALESLKRFLEHQNFIYEGNDDEDKNK